jgi:death-on-curing protein
VPAWISKAAALAIHDEQIAEHGGALGLRDEGLLDSALARPKNLLSYRRAGIPRLAAAYAFGIARNHPFVDGNKRTSLVVAETFLELNGFELVADDAECLEIWNLLAGGEISGEKMASWMGKKARRRR